MFGPLALRVSANLARRARRSFRRHALPALTRSLARPRFLVVLSRPHLVRPTFRRALSVVRPRPSLTDARRPFRSTERIVCLRVTEIVDLRTV